MRIILKNIVCFLFSLLLMSNLKAQGDMETVGADSLFKETYWQAVEGKLSALRQKDDREELSINLLAYGDTARFRKNLPLALRFYTELFNLCKDSEVPESTCIQGNQNIGLLYLEEGLPERAVDFFKNIASYPSHSQLIIYCYWQLLMQIFQK
jgi:tetratricopeptide (TPR) repeat protein